jgi:predicted enzyme related to lactoylglutathione lyase
MRAGGAEQPVAGICHARGANAALPPVWMIYIIVADLEESIRRCPDRGGKLRTQPESMGSQGRFCIIEDPAGAVAGVFEPPKA